MRHEPVISARWPDVKQPHFSGNYKKSQGQKVCRLKAKWLDATDWRTSPDKTGRIPIDSILMLSVKLQSHF